MEPLQTYSMAPRIIYELILILRQSTIFLYPKRKIWISRQRTTQYITPTIAGIVKLISHKFSQCPVSLNTLFVKLVKTALNRLHSSISCQTLLFLKTALKDIFSALPPPPPSLGRSGGRDPLPPPRILEITLDMLHTVCFLLLSCSESSSLLPRRMAVFSSLSNSTGFSATEIS